VNLIAAWDYRASVWIRSHWHNPSVSAFLSKVNRGESFALFLLPFMHFFMERPFWTTVGFLVLFAFLTDRSVLFLKKVIARKRPLVQVMKKKDTNPDMKHSFPSAHSANSMVICFLLVFLFQQSFLFFFFSFFAGIGRILSMHHFISDVLGGWLVGIVWGGLGLLAWKLLLSRGIVL